MRLGLNYTDRTSGSGPRLLHKLRLPRLMKSDYTLDGVGVVAKFPLHFLECQNIKHTNTIQHNTATGYAMLLASHTKAMFPFKREDQSPSELWSQICGLFLLISVPLRRGPSHSFNVWLNVKLRTMPMISLKFHKKVCIIVYEFMHRRLSIVRSLPTSNRLLLRRLLLKTS